MAIAQPRRVVQLHKSLPQGVHSKHAGRTKHLRRPSHARRDSVNHRLSPTPLRRFTPRHRSSRSLETTSSEPQRAPLAATSGRAHSARQLLSSATLRAAGICSTSRLEKLPVIQQLRLWRRLPVAAAAAASVALCGQRWTITSILPEIEHHLGVEPTTHRARPAGTPLPQGQVSTYHLQHFNRKVREAHPWGSG